MPRKGRELEKLVSRLEHWLCPKGATVRSPDYVEDKDGGKRPVDVSIRYQVGSTRLLVVLEVRDRKSRQGTPWIEELAGRRDSIRADKMIAVSSTPFSKRAIEKAKNLGIELRTIEDITEEEVGKWAENPVIRVQKLTWNLLRIDYNFVEDSKGEPVVLAPSLAGGLRSNPTDAPLVYENGSDHPVSARGLIEKAPQCGFDLTRELDLPASGRKEQREIQVTFADEPGAHAPTNQGIMSVAKIRLTIEACVELSSLPPPKVVRYKGPNDEIIEMAEVSCETGDGSYILSYSQQRPANDTGLIEVPAGGKATIYFT